MSQLCKHYHLKLENDLDKWADVSSAKCAQLLLNETCLIYFYSRKLAVNFDLYFNRHCFFFTRKRIEKNTWVYCNSDNADALAAMKALPIYIKKAHIKPVANTLIQQGQVTVNSIEEAQVVCEIFYKHQRTIGSASKMVQTTETRTGYTLEVIDAQKSKAS